MVLSSAQTKPPPTKPPTRSFIRSALILTHITSFAQIWWRIWETVNKWITRAILSVLAAGPVPRHIAFVMDGNRRYARTKNKLVQEGHTDGFYALHHILDICLQLQIKCVSVYAFSIENFKRPDEEVDALMSLAKTKLIELTNNGELLDQYGVRVNIIGRVDLLPPDVQDAVRQAENQTRKNNRSILNICMPYTSRDEMSTAIQATAKAFQKEDLCSEDISETEVEKRLLMTKGGSPSVDVLVRTSGTNRLSDYFLWQSCEDVQIHFTPTLWPDFGLRDLIPIILSYQRKIWFHS